MKKINSIICILLSGLLVASHAFAISLTTKTKRERVQEKRGHVYRQRKLIDEAEESFLKGDYRAVIKACEDMLHLSKKSQADRAYYLLGISYLKLNNLEESKEYLNKVVSQCRRSNLLSDAYLALAEAYFTEENYEEANKLLLHYVRDYPTNPSIPQAYLRLGQIAQREARWEEAKMYFDKVKEDFPLSFEANIAPSGLDEEDFFFTVQLGSFNSLENARKLKKELEEQGHSPYIVEIRSTKSTFYRVRVGKLKSRTEAKYLADKLKKQGFEAKVHP